MDKILKTIRWILVVVLSIAMLIAVIDGDTQQATLFGVLALINKPNE